MLTESELQTIYNMSSDEYTRQHLIKMKEELKKQEEGVIKQSRSDKKAKSMLQKIRKGFKNTTIS